MTRNELLLLVFIAVVAFLFVIRAQYSPEKQSDTENYSIHPLQFFDETTFYKGIAQAKRENKTVSYTIAGGVIPHHLLPGFIIADFFHRLVPQKPRTIILVGPNHPERGAHKALSSLSGWQTPFGVVQPDRKIIRDLVKQNLIYIDEEVLPDEHSVAGIMPFIKQYIPSAEVVPIILTSRFTQKDLRELAVALAAYQSKDTVLLASVDFSHYLTNKKAQEKDKTTLRIIDEYNYAQLLSLNNDYLDSPSSIVVFLMVMQEWETTRRDIYFHTNSGELQNDESGATTSYFSIAYY